MATRDIVCWKQHIDHYGNGSAGIGLGEHHLMTGRAADGWAYRTFLQFTNADTYLPGNAYPAATWGGVGKIVSAKLRLTTAGPGVHGTPAAAPTHELRYVNWGGIWYEHSIGQGENVWSGSYREDLITRSNSPVISFSSPQAANQHIEVDITAFIEHWAPPTIKKRDGTPCNGGTNNGLHLMSPNEGFPNPSSFQTFWSRSADNFADDKPLVVLTYEPVAAPPNPAGNLFPVGSVASADHFTGSFSDPNPGDVLSQTHIQVYEGGPPVGALLWETTVPASPGEAGSGLFSVPIPALIRSGVVYAWDVRHQDQGGLWGPWQGTRPTFRILTQPPVCVLLNPLAATYVSMSGVRFRGAFSDPDSTDVLGSFRIQLRATTPPGDSAWDTDTNLWDSGDVTPTATEKSTTTFDRPYGGKALAAGTYSWRARVQDQWGVNSPWVYSQVTLTIAWSPDPGDIDFLTGYGERRSPTRVLIRQLDPATGRGPKAGPPIGIFEDASNIGASRYYNAPGEVFFTVPATHPQVSVVEPWQVHYTVEYWRADRYVPVFDGIVTDFDATGDDVVFYGMDYEGLLDKVVDSRWTAETAESAPPTGSKYTDKTITEIIADQLAMARAKTNSPVNFIQPSAYDTFAEKVTYYTSFTPVSTTIFGLVESHRQGTGKQSRFWVRRNAAGTGFEFLLKDDPGTQRDNLRLEYGGLVQGFRLTAFGDWASTVHGIGRGRTDITPYYKSESGPGIDPVIWGSIEKVGVWDDVVDRNDLQRRVKQAAASASRVGKRIAMALRVDSILPFDGYDIGDTIPVHIKRGVVDTTRYGSGLWTIVGVEWHTYPDGHTDNTLVVLPKEDGVPPDPDLIPSDPIIIPGSEWEIGYVPPVEDTNTGKFYLDLTTGIVYELNPDGTYSPVTVPPDPDPPTGLTLTSSLVYDQTGDPVVKLTATLVQPPGTANRGSWVEITSAQDGAGDPIWDERAVLLLIPAGETSTSIEGVAGNTLFFARAWSVDFVGVPSTITPAEELSTVMDDIAPPIPSGFVAQGTIKAIMAQWTPSTASDLAYYDFRYAPDNGSGTGVGGSPVWTYQRARTSFIYVGGLPDPVGASQRYWCQSRAVDRSGNVDNAGVAVNYADFPEVGWSILASADVTLVDGALIQEGSIQPQHIDFLTADLIISGLIQVNTTVDGFFDGIRVMADDGAGNPTVEIGRWDEHGLSIRSATDSTDYVLIDQGSVTVYLNGAPMTAITPAGINASAITFGTMPQVQNLVRNSSFESADFSTATTVNVPWTASADWTATRVGSDTNVTTGALDLQETGATY